jgi:hypothetical protein
MLPHLAAFRGVDVFRSTDRLKVIWDVKAKLKLRNAAKSESSLNDLASKMSCNNPRTLLRGKETGQWLPVLLPSTVNGTELSAAQEFLDALLLDAKSQQSKKTHKVLEPTRERRKRSTLRPALSNVGTSLPLWHPRTVYLARNHEPCSRNCPRSLLRSGRSRTQRCLAMSMLR